MKSILLVGAGQLGSRHLQALALLDMPYEIYVSDPVGDSLAVAKSRYEEVEPKAEHQVLFVSSLEQIERVEIDFAIIATNSAVRYDVYNRLVDLFKIKFIVMEKVLFQELSHYSAVCNDLKTRGINAWVNCPSRMYPFYMHIKDNYIQENTPVELSNRGGEWIGLGCNTIHYLDIINFLTGDELKSVDTSHLDQSIIQSKRSGYIEFTGTLKANFDSGSSLNITAVRGSDEVSELVIRQGQFRIVLNEFTGEYKVYRAEELVENSKLSRPFQSNLTQTVIKQIVDTGDCQLPHFDVSMALHIPFFEALLEFQDSVLGLDEKILRIT